MKLNARPRRLRYRKIWKRGGPKLVFVQYGFCCGQKTTDHHTKSTKKQFKKENEGFIRRLYQKALSEGFISAPAPAWLMAAVTLTAVVSLLSLIC